MFLQEGLGPYSFVIFGVICFITLVYIWAVIPETKNKTFQGISQLFAKRNRVEIKVEKAESDTKEEWDKVTAF